MEEIINNQENVNKGSKKFGVASFVLGIVSLVLAILMPKVCLICGILSIVFAVVSKKGSMSTAGLVLGIIGTVFSLLFVTIEMDIANDTDNQGIVSEGNIVSEEEARSKIIGTWYGTDDLSGLETDDYIIVFELDEDYNFTWGEYGDLENNRVEGKYTFEDLHKTNYGKTATYYQVELHGDKFYVDGILQDQEYGNTYEFGVINTNGVEDSGVLASTITGSLYYLKKVE